MIDNDPLTRLHVATVVGPDQGPASIPMIAP